MISNFELFETIHFFDWLWRKTNCRCRPKDSPDLSFQAGQGRILWILSREDDLSTKELSHLTGLQISSLNEILSKMEKKNLILRYPKPTDKRIILNKITPSGREILPENQDFSVFDVLTTAERQELYQIFKKLNTVLEDKVFSYNDEKLETFVKQRKDAISRHIEMTKEQEC